MSDDKLQFSVKVYLVGALVGAAPGVLLWLGGASSHIAIGVLILGVIIGEIIGIAVGQSSERK